MQKKYVISLIALSIIIGASLLFAFQNRDTVTSENSNPLSSSSAEEEFEEQAPETVNTTEKPNVDDEQADTETAAEENNGTLVITEEEAPENQGFPIETNHYKVEQPKFSNDTYAVTLYAIINSPSQYQEYLEQLRQFKAEALTYMEKNGVDLATANITYSPQEAADL